MCVFVCMEILELFHLMNKAKAKKKEKKKKKINSKTMVDTSAT